MGFLSRSALAILGLAGLLTSGPAFAGTTSTSFEFFDFDGFFEVGTSPDVVTFVGGQAKIILEPDLYHTGHFSWMIDAGNTGTITFETQPTQVTLFLKDGAAAVQSVLTVFDQDDVAIATFNGNTADWTTVDVVVGEGQTIKTVTVTNNSGVANDYAAIDDFTSDAGDPIFDPIPEPIGQTPFAVGLQTVASGLVSPIWGTWSPAFPARVLFVADQIGILYLIDTPTGFKKVFLDVTGLLVPLDPNFDERGLLGFAFHPNYANNGLLYTYTSQPALPNPDFTTLSGLEVPDHQSFITEWQVPNPMNFQSVVDPASARVLLRIDEPQFNHDGGAMSFGPDGMLYVSLGDGGGANDVGVGHTVPQGNGQDPGNVLGTVLRIDPLGTGSANGQYDVPPDNPFFNALTNGGQGGCDQDGFCDEIFAYGFRNPYRFSFDLRSGVLILADVGQNNIEEIDIVQPGRNYGWNLKEGTFCFDPATGGIFECMPGDVPPGLADPIAQYDHDEGIAVVGGFIYRGRRIPALRGRYVFGDYTSSFANLADGRLFMLAPGGIIFELQITGLPDLGLAVLGFGQDKRGEVYVLANATGTPSGNTGVVIKIVPGP